MKLYKLLLEIFQTRLNLIREQLLQTQMNEYYLAAGKAIAEITMRYPSSFDDAVIIYDEWCKGLLTSVYPSKELLRKYAEYTAKEENFRQWQFSKNNIKD